MHLANN